jgi:acyl-CoA thioester hydrolase
MDEAGAPVECGLAVVHPWLCDEMGHLTTRHYLGMFDDAAYQLFAIIGYDATAAKAEHWGWADVRHEIDYRSELAAGSVVRIHGRVTALGRSSITAQYDLTDRADGRLCAVLTAKTVCFDLAQRRSRPLPAGLRGAAAALFAIEPAAPSA